MSAVVYTPATVTTLENMSLSSGTVEIVKKNPTCSRISVFQAASDIPIAKTIFLMINSNTEICNEINMQRLQQVANFNTIQI